MWSNLTLNNIKYKWYVILFAIVVTEKLVYDNMINEHIGKHVYMLLSI